MQLKDFVNKKVNSRNHQVSFDFQKRKARDAGIDIEDLMEMKIDEISKKMGEHF